MAAENKGSSAGAAPAENKAGAAEASHKAVSLPVHLCRAILNTKLFSAVGLMSLGVALFGNAICLLLDLPDEPWVLIVDITMTLMTIFFIIEIVIRCVGEYKTYFRSFYFVMDVVGTLSMVFEISYLLGPAGKMDSTQTSINTVLMRTVRAAKLGARAGRMAKVMKCLAALHNPIPWATTPAWPTFEQRASDEGLDGSGVEAKVLNARLKRVLSTKVSMLTILLVLCVPLFSLGRFPENDLSLQAWTFRLENDYDIAGQLLDETGRNSTNIFAKDIENMVEFFADLSYSPYKVEGFPKQILLGEPRRQVMIPGAQLMTKPEPRRWQNIVRSEVSMCQVVRPGCDGGVHASVWYDMTKVRQYDAGMDIAVIVFMIVCMCLETFDLSLSLDMLVVKPVEKMMATVHEMSVLLNQVTEVREVSSRNLTRNHSGTPKRHLHKSRTEAERLEVAFKKLAKLTSVFLNESIIDKEELDDLEYESKAVVEMLGHNPIRSTQRVLNKVDRSALSTSFSLVVDELPVPKETVESWSLDLLGMSKENLHKVALFLVFDSKLSGNLHAGVRPDEKVFLCFLDKVGGQYVNSNPYHNYTHACDVLASLCRVLTMVSWQDWMSNVDAYALLVSALCHDVGHPGKTNPFLVEIGDELAVRYNDKCPLENMHCAKLFEMINNPETNVFELLDHDAYKQARSVCIGSILHTDNALHFDMVKRLVKLYEVSQAICDQQAPNLEKFNNDYLNEVLLKEAVLWCELFLHMADISNPLKPFELSRLWASRVVDEFFLQGDEEKRRGIPVGMLNDRDKVNKLSSEHGFINFLVAPLVTSAGCVIPLLVPLSKQLLSTLESWRDVWMNESAITPTEEESKRRDADVQKLKATVDDLVAKNDDAQTLPPVLLPVSGTVFR